MSGRRVRRTFSARIGLFVVATLAAVASCKEVRVTSADVSAIVVSAPTTEMTIGQSAQFSASVRDIAGRVLHRDVAWTSDRPAVASVSTSGVVTAVSAGTVIITATAEGRSDAVTVVVEDEAVATVDIDRPVASVQVGDTLRLTATARSADGTILSPRPITWTTTDFNVAEVSIDGLVTAKSVGSVTITATVEGIRGEASITVNAALVTVSTVRVEPASASLIVGDSVLLRATATASDGTVIPGRRVIWTTNTSAVAGVDSTGRVRALSAGTARITATVDGVAGNSSITVSAVPQSTITVTPTSSTLALGNTIQMQAVVRDPNGAVVTGLTVQWSTSDGVVASIDANGLVRANGVGIVTISAVAAGLTGTATVFVVAQPVAGLTITPVTPTLFAGDSVLMTANPVDANGTRLNNRLVTWSTASPAVAIIVPTGPSTQQAWLHGVSAGTSQVRAMVETRSDSTLATIVPRAELVAGPLTVTPATPTDQQPVAVNATITNTGSTAAANVAWQLKVDAVIVASGTIPNLAANGGSFPVAATNLGPYAVGLHTTELVVDPANTIPEPDETNNTRGQPFTVAVTPVIDLIAGPIVVTPGTPTNQQTIGLTATVTNSGNTAALNVAWELHVDGTVVSTGTIPSLAANASAPVSASSLGPYPVGAHVAQLVVDPANAIVEPNEADNTRSQPFTVSVTPVIELVAGPVAVNPAAPTDQQTIDLSATVTNNGNTAAPNVAWQLKVDGTVVSSGSIPSLAANATVPVSTASLGPFPSGSHNAQLVIDPANAITEPNETDNTTSQPFFVTSLNLVAGQVVVNPVSPTHQDLVQLSAPVSNTGNTATDVPWELRVDGAFVAGGTILNLAPNGGSAIVGPVSMGPFAAGPHTAQLVVDPLNAIAESNETDNTSSKPFTVTAVNLVADQVVVTPSSPTHLQSVDLTAMIANQGNITAQNIVWQLKVDGTVVGSGTIPTLANGVSLPVGASGLGPFSAGPHTAELLVDPFDAVPEPDETDNTSSQTFTVTAVDLAAGPVTVTPLSPTDQQTVGLGATVTNNGNTAASNVDWQLQIDGVVLGSGTIGSLAAGGTAPVTAANLGPFTAGAHTAQLVVDPLDAIAEPDENDNTSSRLFTVTTANLVADPIVVTPPAPTDMQTATFNTSITNTGSVAAADVEWELKVDGLVLGSGKITSLAAGANTPVSVPNLGPFAAGPHTAELVVDPLNTVSESDETDNSSFLPFNVTVAPIVELVAGAVTVTPPSPTDQQLAGLSATVTNTGNTVALNVEWQLKVDGTTVNSGTIASLAASGGNALVAASNLGPYAAGLHGAELVVDPANAIVEPDEGNTNSQPFTVVVAPAELVAGPVVVNPATPTDLDLVGLSATVTNTGNTTAVSVAWQLKVDGVVVGNGSIPSLAAGASVPVSAPGLGPYSLGPHTAELVVDPLNAIAEPDEGNNTSSQPFTVVVTPVLDLVAGVVVVTPPTPTDQQTVDVNATVLNTGNTAATNVAWELKVDGVVVNSGVIPSLAASVSAPVSASVLGPYTVGLHAAQLVVDPANAIAEPNEVDNIRSQAFTVTATPFVNLVADAVVVTPPTPTDQQTVGLGATVTNNGNSAASNVAWELKVDGVVVNSGTIPLLAASASAPVNATGLGPYAAGPHAAELVVDPSNVIVESDETDNTSSQLFTATVPPVIELVADPVVVTPALPTDQQTVGLTATVSNTGNTVATDVTWELKVDGVVVGSGTIPSLAASGGSVMVSAPGLGPYAVGQHTAELVVDGANAIAEPDETNNTSTLPFIVTL